MSRKMVCRYRNLTKQLVITSPIGISNQCISNHDNSNTRELGVYRATCLIADVSCRNLADHQTESMRWQQTTIFHQNNPSSAGICR